MVVRIYFHNLEDAKHAYGRNASRSLIDPPAVFFSFNNWNTVKNAVMNQPGKVVIPIMVQDVKPWMSDAVVLRDYTHPTDATYLIGGSDFVTGGIDLMFEANKSDFENNADVEWLIIPTKATMNGGLPSTMS